MEHGAGFDPDKVIEVAAVRTARTIVYYFKDPGPGFNPRAPGLVATERRSALAPDDREAEGKRPGGFGMLLTAKLVDEVHYNERGNEVFLVKHLDKIKEKKRNAPRAGREEARANIRGNEGSELLTPAPQKAQKGQRNSCVTHSSRCLVVAAGATGTRRLNRARALPANTSKRERRKCSPAAAS